MYGKKSNQENIEKIRSNKTAVKKSKTDLELKTDASPDIPSVRAPNNPIPDIENIKTTNK